MRTPAADLLWSFEPATGLGVLITPGEGRHVLGGLAPEQDLELAGSVFDTFGVEYSFNEQVRTLAPVERVIITEVLANPLGAEPQQEWVELFNDGLAPVVLAGWQLEDGGGITPLPAETLQVGEYALVVREDYNSQFGLDVPPASGTPLLLVAQLGQRGLSNSGEPLIVRDPSGEIASFVPVVLKPKAGVSIARRFPYGSDEPSSFAYHHEPGASPGEVNDITPDDATLGD